MVGGDEEFRVVCRGEWGGAGGVRHPIKAKKKIPVTDSIAEFAEFWGNYDLTEFDTELFELVENVFERTPFDLSDLSTKQAEYNRRWSNANAS